MINDISYHYDGYNFDNTLTFEDLGPPFTQVQFRVDGNIHNPKYSSKNGDAAFLEPGTPVYTLNGYAPTFRLAIFDNGKVKIYEASRNPAATTGADLLDLKDKVEHISINSEIDGTTVLATITDPVTIANMVGMTLDSELMVDSGQPQGERYFISFHLLDGTVVTRSYWIEVGLMTSGIHLPQEFADLVWDALDE